MSMPPRWLFWHRRDLRLADNRGLMAAVAATAAVTGVVVLDPAELRVGAAGLVTNEKTSEEELVFVLELIVSANVRTLT